MGFLSLLLRVLSICAAVAVVAFYILGGNQLKQLKSDLETENAENRRLQVQLEEEASKLQKTKEQLDSTTLELANHKRDKRLNESEVLIVKQELEKVRQEFEHAKTAKLALADENESLRRETIDLKAQGLDPNFNPDTLHAKIDQQQDQINGLELKLRDANTVLTGLFASNDSHNDDGQGGAHKTLVRQFVPEHQILIIEAGSSEGIQENREFSLLLSGQVVARVKAARVKPNFSIVNILSSKEGSIDNLRTGSQIEYTL